MILVLDTSVLSALLSNDDKVVRALSRQTYDQMVIPLATDAEMRFGFAYGQKPVKNLENYELFKQQFGVEVVSPDQDTAILYADLTGWARQHGVALSHNDIWIAATCVQVAGSLATLDGDFANLPQLRLAKL